MHTHTRTHAHTPGDHETPHGPHTRLHLQQGLSNSQRSRVGSDELLRPHSNTVAGASEECYTRPHPCQPSLELTELTEPHPSEANMTPLPSIAAFCIYFSTPRSHSISFTGTQSASFSFPTPRSHSARFTGAQSAPCFSFLFLHLDLTPLASQQQSVPLVGFFQKVNLTP